MEPTGDLPLASIRTVPERGGPPGPRVLLVPSGGRTEAAGTIRVMTDTIDDPRVIEPEAPQYNATLVRREDETESLAYFWVRFDGEPTPFEAGQYMTIGVMVDGQDRPASVLGRLGAGGRRLGRLRVLRAARPGRHVHAAAVAAAGRPRACG